MRNTLLALALILPCSLIAQDNSPFPGTYILNGYLLQEDTLTLISRTSVEGEAFLDVYAFSEERSITYNREIPSGIGVCVNGLLYVDAAKYKFRENAGILIMDIDGGHLVTDEFRYKAKYRVELIDEDSYRLVRLKVKRQDIKQDGQIPFQASASSLQEHTPTGLVPGAY